MSFDGAGKTDRRRYGTGFFEEFKEGSGRSAHAILSHVFAWLSPRSVVDVGCGAGAWLAAARELGAERLLGLDGDYVDRNILLVRAEEFAVADLERQDLLRAIPADHAVPFDLVMCLEVAEHLSAKRAESFVAELTRLGGVILFSAAIPFQGGVHHVNEQWPEYWALLFAGQGYDCLDPLRPLLWYRTDVEWWYRQNALIFVRRGGDASARMPGHGAAGSRPLALVHPEDFLFQVLHSIRAHRAAAADEEKSDFRSLAKAWYNRTGALPHLAAAERAATRPGAPDVFPRTRTEVIFPEHELATRDAAITRANEELAVIQRNLTARDKEVSRATDQIQALQLDLGGRDADLSRARGENTALRRELASRDAALSRARDDAASLRLKLHGAQTAQMALANEIPALLARRGETEAELVQVGDRLREELRRVYASRSWRIAAPLRRLGALGRRIGARRV